MIEFNPIGFIVIQRACDGAVIKVRNATQLLRMAFEPFKEHC